MSDPSPVSRITVRIEPLDGSQAFEMLLPKATLRTEMATVQTEINGMFGDDLVTSISVQIDAERDENEDFTFSTRPLPLPRVREEER